MKNMFPGYYQPSEQEFKDLWDSAIFIFDTNSLLNLFRYPKDSREMLLKVLEKIQDRIWIPYQVAVEYHRHLDDEIVKQKQGYNVLRTMIESSISGLIKKLNDQRYTNTNFENIIKKLEDVSTTAEKELNEQEKSHPNLGEIKKGLSRIIGEKIGREYSQEDLENIYSEGEKRYEQNVPPGYMDLKEKGERKSYHNKKVYIDKYGDLVYWKQILDKSKEESVESVILVTDDTKEDWWYVVKGETKGPHPQLVQEFNSESSGKLFYMYKTEQFIRNAKSHFSLDENIDEVVREIENTKNLDDYYNNKPYFIFEDKKVKKYLAEFINVQLENELEKYRAEIVFLDKDLYHENLNKIVNNAKLIISSIIKEDIEFEMWPICTKDGFELYFSTRDIDEDLGILTSKMNNLINQMLLGYWIENISNVSNKRITKLID